MFRLVGLLISLMSALLLAVQSRAYQPAAVVEFIRAPDCMPPCWHGIRPGHTTGSDAVAILRADPRIEGLNIANWDAQRQLGWLEWSWRADHPLLEGMNWMAIFGNEVQGLSLSTRITLGDIWLAFGAPDAVQKSQVDDLYTLRLAYRALQVSVTVSSFSCDGSLATLWHKPVMIGIGAWMNESRSPAAVQPRDLAGCQTNP